MSLQKRRRRKITEFGVRNNGSFLGYINWRPGWRKYVFTPHEAVFDSICLQDIVDFLKNLMEQRKNVN
jgi:hypothetical protein